MKTLHQLACVRPVKTDALITVNGLGFNTRAPERVPHPRRRRCEKTSFVKLKTGEWINAKGGVSEERGAEIMSLAPVKWYEAQSFNPAWGMSKREWLRRRAAKVQALRNETVCGQMKAQSAEPVSLAALRSEQAVTKRWDRAELRRMAGF